MMRRLAIGVAALACLAVTAADAPALFHLAHITEVNVQGGGDPGVQYVEITMDQNLQNFVTDSVLGAWDCTGTYLGDQLLVPDDVAGGAGIPWLMSTTDPVGGVTPDFVIPAANLPACGQVCWGAPGLTVPDPGSWDHSDPTLYTDCVAYGGYTGTTGTHVGTPTALPPGDGTYSLTRISTDEEGTSLTNFELRCPSPTNNVQMAGTFGPCSDGTTTTTLGGGTTTTTTTLPGPGASEPLSGKKLDLRMKKGETKKLLLVSKDGAITLGRGNGSADDPVVSGGRLTIASSSAAGAFLQEFPLDGEWRYIKNEGDDRGYKWKSKSSAIRKVLIKPGKTIKIVGKGPGMGFDLDADPDPVIVELRAAAHRWCWSFGGETKLKPDKRWRAKNAAAPSACPP